MRYLASCNADSQLVRMLVWSASVLSALQTFLDYQGRSERHRTAAAKYKGIVRELEEVLSTPDQDIRLSPPWFADLRRRFEALEQDMPVVAPSIYDEVEHAYPMSRSSRTRSVFIRDIRVGSQ